MSVQVEKLDKNMAKLTVEVPAEEFEKALQAAYLKQRGKINVPGFRKGRVPRQMVEKLYGVEIFYEDAANELISTEYPNAREESGLDVVSRPGIDVTQIEKGKPFIFEAEVAVKPEVALGQYKGVELKKAEAEVSDEEVATEVNQELERNARMLTVDDRPIQEDDTAVIDYEGFVDGAPFEGGKGENHSLAIGSHSFIEGFEDQLIGKRAGDELDVHVTFPEEYHGKELSGKPAVFKVKIHEIKAKELPELDDEFAQDVSEFDTLEEYKEDVRKRLLAKKLFEEQRLQEDAAIEKVVERSQIDVPEPMIEYQVEGMMQDFGQRLSQQGLNLEQYLQFTGSTPEKLEAQMRPDAEKRIRTGLVLEQIAAEEKLEASEEDVDAEIAKMAEAYKMEADQLKEYMGEGGIDSLKKDLAVQKAVDFVMEHVKESA